MKRWAWLCFLACTAVTAFAASSSAFGDDATVDVVWPSIGPRPADLQVPEPAPLSAGAPAAPLPRAAAGVSPGVALGFSGPDAFSPVPPDTHIAVGLGSGTSGRVVVVTNGGFQLFDK